jgi:uncharacterized protein (DUF3820 family)
MSNSKPLGHNDDSGFEFVKEMLGDNATAAVNFDRLQKHPQLGYIIFEYLLCEEEQTVTPYYSHPNRYWNKNKSKFLSLWRAKIDFNSILYLVNYAKKGTKAENEILLIEVLDVNENGITKEKDTKFTRKSFQEWFVKLNNECLTGVDVLIDEIYEKKSLEDIGKFQFYFGKYKGKKLEDIYNIDRGYLEWLINNNVKHSAIILSYLQKIKDLKSTETNS